MNLRRLPCLALFAALAACTAREPTMGPGATGFVTEEPEYDNHSTGPSGGASDMGLAATADGGGSSPGAPMGRSGTVEEGDIYRIDHNRLFYFNTYRGLMIYDLADAQHPQKISRVPVYGYPVEMYVDGDRVYALVRDALYLTQGGQKFEEHHTSQLITVDISDLAHPVVLKTIDIVGQLREGLSRKIDDTIYVVSYIPQSYYGWGWYDWGWYGQIDTDKEQAWTYSFNVADPANPQLVDKLQIFEGGSASSSLGGGGGIDRWFQGVAISATANTLEVVENWQTYGYVPYGPSDCGASFASQQAVVSLIDISDPAGQIHLYTKFETYGSLRDQFKQTYVYDDTTKKAYYFGIFARREWESSGCSGSSFTQNSFQAWDVTDGANPTRVGFLPFGDKDETVSASLFDTSRHVAYAITSHAIDPMYAIGYADPTAPSVLSQIDGLNGDIDVFSFIGSTRYLLGIGTDNSDACTGFATGSAGWHTGVAVSILDVQDLNATRLVQRRCIDVQDAQWVSSPANRNLDQGHKMIGMGSTGSSTIVTVPVDYWKRTDEDHWWWYEGGSSVGVMSFDLAAYDPQKPPEQQNVLTNHGSFDHSHGTLRRTIVFQHEEVTGTRPMVLNLSDGWLSLFDVSNLDHPVKQSDLEIAPDVQELYKFGDYMVEHVRDEANYYGNWELRSEFRVKPMGGAPLLDDTAPVARFSVGQVERVERWKDALVIFRRNGVGDGYVPQTSQVVIYDLSTPTAPVLRSITDLGLLAGFGYSAWWCGWRGYFGGWWWSNPSSWMSIADGVVFQVSDYGEYPDWKVRTRLVYVDLADLSDPRVSVHMLPEEGGTVAGITPDDSDPRGFFVTLKDKLGERPGEGNYKLVSYAYYAQRWSVADGDIVAGERTNLPGQLVRSWRSGERTMLLSQDRVYRHVHQAGSSYGWYESDPRLHLLERTGEAQGTLRDSTTVAGRYLEGLTTDGDRLYLTTGYGYAWSATPPATPPDTSDHLAIFDLSQQKLDRKFDDGIGLSAFSVMGSDGARLFLNLYGKGVLVLDATDAAHPLGRDFLRTLGWGSHLELAGDTMFVAAGEFGVFQRDLTAGLTRP